MFMSALSQFGSFLYTILEDSNNINSLLRVSYEKGKRNAYSVCRVDKEESKRQK